MMSTPPYPEVPYWLLVIEGDLEPQSWRGPYTYDEMMRHIGEIYNNENGHYYVRSMLRPFRLETFSGGEVEEAIANYNESLTNPKEAA